VPATRGGLRQGFIDGLGVVGQSRQKHPFCGEIHRPQFHMSLKEEAVCIERHLEHLGQTFILARGNDSRAQHEKIGFYAEVVVKDRFMDNDPKAVSPLLDTGFLFFVVTDEEDTCLPCLFVVVLFEAIRSNVPVEDIDVRIRIEGF
jgi:hypothetical protein